MKHSSDWRVFNLFAQGMADNPLHIAALGSNRARRVEVLRLMFKALLADSPRELLGAYGGSELVGALGYTRGFDCRPPGRDVLKFLPVIGAARLRTSALAWWLVAWLRRDPPVPHAHLGPVAVAPEAQRTGVGTALVERYVHMLDENNEAGYLETDSLNNVAFYRRFGFQVVQRKSVLGTSNWFMIRNTGR